MFYSLLAPVLGVALAGGFVDASPTPFNVNAVAVADSYAPVAALAGDLEARTLKPCIFELGKSWDDKVLFKGSAGASIELDLSLPKAAISGEIQVQVTDKFLAEPIVRVDLGGVKAYFEMYLAASKGVFESVELVASSRLKLDVPGHAKVNMGAAFALDLVVGVSAAVDVSAGFHVTFPEGCYVEISLLTKEIVRHKLNGLIAQSLPISVGDGVDITTGIKLDIGLRLRACIGVGAGVGLLGLDIGAGADVAIWVNLFSYTTKIGRTSTCPCTATETFALSAGVAVEVDVKVGQVLDLCLAPTVMVTLSTAELATVCLPSLPGGGYGLGCDGGVCPTKSLPGPKNGSGNGKGAPSSQFSSGLPVSSSPAMSKDTEATVSSHYSLSASTTALPAATAGSDSGSGSGSHSGAGTSTGSAYPSGSGPFPGSALSVSVPGSGAGSGLPSASTVYAASLALSSGSGSDVGSAYPSQTGGNGPITTSTADGSMITSTITTTQTYTITSCAVSVPNCPASHTQKIVTSTVITTTTVCPANEATTTLATTVTKTTCEVPAPPTQVMTVTLTTCPVPQTSTFQAPTGYPTLQPTVTITGCGGNGNGEGCGQGPYPSKSTTVGVVKPSGRSSGGPVPSGGYPTGGHPTGGKPTGVYPTESPVPTKGTATATENLPVKPTVSPSPPVATAGASGRFLRGSGVAALGAVAAAMLL